MEALANHSGDESVDIGLPELDRRNRVSWALVKSECDRLEKSLSEKRITLDQLFGYLQSLDPAAKDRLGRMSNSIKEVLLAREKMDSYFAALAQSNPASSPVRFRRLNRA